MGVEVTIDQVQTSASVTRDVVHDELPAGSRILVVGMPALSTTIFEGSEFVPADEDPDATIDAVVVGLDLDFTYAKLVRASDAVRNGARFIATNPDVTGPSAEGPLPATGSVAAMITKATGREPYFVGKPNPMMFRSALNRIEAHSENTVMVGDRMDTDVVAGIEAGLETILVLTGSTTVEDVDRYPFRPSRVLPSIAEAIDLI